MKKKIKVGMVGLGSIGKVHSMANLVMPLIMDDIPFSVQPGKIYRRNRTGEPGFGEGYAVSLKEILEDPETNVVDICTPNYLHKEQALEAIEYGKNVYLEKPLGLNYTEAKLIAQKAAGKGVQNQTAFVYRFMPAIVNMRDEIKNGLIGDIIDFKAVCWHSGYLNRERPISWKLQQETSGGGPLLDLGIHLADIIRFVLGEVQEVSAEMKTVIEERPEPDGDGLKKVDVEDWARAKLILERGIEGTLEVSRVASVLEEMTELVILGTRGSLKFSTQNPNILTYYSQERGVQEIRKVKPISEFARHLEGIYPPGKLSLGWMVNTHFASLVNFYLNIAAGEVICRETPTFAEAAKSQAVIDACYLSAEQNRKITPLNRVFNNL